MTINLSDYIGQTITVKLRNRSIVTDTVVKSTHWAEPIIFFNRAFYENSGKVSKKDLISSPYDIIEIFTPMKKQGLAQKSPNIDFSRFLNKRVAVKFRNGNVVIAELTRFDSDSIFLKGVGWYNQSVEVIYDEDAFKLSLQEIPVDESVKKVVDLAKGMTTEQIAEVISRLKGDTK